MTDHHHMPATRKQGKPKNPHRSFCNSLREFMAAKWPDTDSEISYRTGEGKIKFSLQFDGLGMIDSFDKSEIRFRRRVAAWMEARIREEYPQGFTIVACPSPRSHSDSRAPRLAGFDRDIWIYQVDL